MHARVTQPQIRRRIGKRVGAVRYNDRFGRTQFFFQTVAERLERLPSHVFAQHAKGRFYAVDPPVQFGKLRHLAGAHDLPVVIAGNRAAACDQRDLFHRFFFLAGII